MSTSRRCTATTQSGSPCKAWAVHGTEPPLCSAHAGRNIGAGAPEGNDNAKTHGAYSDLIQPEELARLVTDADDTTLQDEMALTRLANRRLIEHLQDDNTPRADAIAAAQAIFRGARTVALLLRDQRALSGEAADGISGALAQAIHELASEWGIEPI